MATFAACPWLFPALVAAMVQKAASGCRKEKAPGDDPRAYANFNARAPARGSELRGLLLSFGYR